jgi:acyl-CoA dehydrogenase
MAYLLRLVIFPLGTWLTKPSDSLDHKVAQLLQTPCSTRSRLGHGQYLTRKNGNVFGQLEKTLENIIACEPVFTKVCLALNEKLPFYHLDKVAQLGLEANAISAQEAQLLIKAEQGRKEIIAVDDFDASELRAQ